MKIKKLVKLAPMMLLTFLLGLSGCSGNTAADARVNDHPSEADEELHGDGFLYDECLLSDRADLKDAMDACGGADCNVRGACGEYLM